MPRGKASPSGKDSKELEVGDPAPDFSLPSTEGRDVSLEEFRGKKSVVLFFYPKDDTPGCTKEACQFRDDLSRLRTGDAVILGVSLDGLGSHQKFVQKYSLPFPLLSDEKAVVSKAYGVYKKKSLYGRTFWGIERSTFLIGSDGRLRGVFRRVQVDGHSQELLDLISSPRAG
jgi:peroxiredoxin Q/BCP